MHGVLFHARTDQCHQGRVPTATAHGRPETTEGARERSENVNRTQPYYAFSGGCITNPSGKGQNNLFVTCYEQDFLSPRWKRARRLVPATSNNFSRTPDERPRVSARYFDQKWLWARHTARFSVFHYVAFVWKGLGRWVVGSAVKIFGSPELKRSTPPPRLRFLSFPPSWGCKCCAGKA